MADAPFIAGGSKILHCVIVTPEKAVLDEVADFIALPMFDGELGVAPGRQPLIGRLGIGELRVKNGETTRRYYVDGGFAQIRANVVTVLTAKAVPESELNAATARQALASALATPASTEHEQIAKLKSQTRARAQLRVLHAPGTGGHEAHG